MKSTKSIIDSISNLALKHGKRKRLLTQRRLDEELDKEMEKRTKNDFEAILSNSSLDKFGRDRAFQVTAARHTQTYWDQLTEEANWRKETGAVDAITDSAVDSSADSSADSTSDSSTQSPSNEATLNRQVTFPAIRAAVERSWARQFRQRILTKGSRCDGRYLDQLRLIRCETNLHEPLHGSALFQRWAFQISDD